MESRLWDAFRAYPRVVREAYQDDDAVYQRNLQILKLAIFILGNLTCIIGTFVSKSIIYLLATNIGIIPPQRDIRFYQKCKESGHEQNVTHFAFLCASLWVIQSVPDICTVILNIYKHNKENTKKSRIFWQIVFLEACRSTGLGLLIAGVYPMLDIPRCVLLSCAIVMLSYLKRTFNNIINYAFLDAVHSNCSRFLSLIGVFPLIICFFVMASGSMVYVWQDSDNKFLQVLPLAMILCSIGYWESWIDVESKGGYFDTAFKIKYGVKKLNRLTRVYCGIVRLICSFSVLYWALRHHGVPVGTLLKSFVHWSALKGEGRLFLLAYIAVFANYYVRVCSRFLAAMKLKIVPILHPVFITPPIMFIVYHSLCHFASICEINELLHPLRLNLVCRKYAHGGGVVPDYWLTPLYMLLYLMWSYGFIIGNDYSPTDDIIESMPPMLVGLDPMQSQVIFQYSVGSKHKIDLEEEEDEDSELRIINTDVDKVITLYVCATMWHETKMEMSHMLKSVLKLDEEHARRLEVHIYLDDAWENDSECGRIPNSYFKQLFELLIELTGDDIVSSDPHSRVLLNTSYGGRLVMRLNAGTLLFVHLKDKSLIRNKKRWSQVMYMYYLLGHRIMDSHMSVEDKQVYADNTYLLAIDGDSMFEPSAVIKLIHMMNIKSDIGCACGRIHPIGEGIMVWYQKFEYAIAHWFQKSAEHVFGCVLCAPGCFSLFRASALMDDNVMNKYTKTASEPRHFVQYDQGEDRWLSTLLLKQGYRIEYAAAADAETYAPEGFEEFFNQRRRWTPSSVANTIDLLADYRLAIKNNESISMLYIAYQMMVIGFSMLGPAIIFSMLVYAQVSAFGIDSTTVLYWNAAPILSFIAACFLAESSFQLAFAKYASVVYAFVMLAVMIATANQIVLETIFSPTSMFVLGMVLIFMFASFIHPKEFRNILFGLVFFLMIPSTYLYLSLYSLINLNVINWGTREAVNKAMGKETKSAGFLEGVLKKLGIGEEDSTFTKLMSSYTQSKSSDTIKQLEERLEKTERMLSSVKDGDLSVRSLDSQLNTNIANQSNEEETAKSGRIVKKRYADTSTEGQPARFLWMDAEYLQGCDRGILKTAEEKFWDQLIEKYLKPMESSKQEQADIAEGLVGLRNKIAFSIILLNGLLVLAVFLLQRHKDVLSVQFTPYEGFQWTKMNETTGKFDKTDEALKVDPLGMGIIFFLFGILIVQAIGMIIHRLNTLVEALHEVSEMEPDKGKSDKFKDHQNVLEEARQMLATVHYDKAHGAEGYVRKGVDNNAESRNVLYKLHSQFNS
ncbi:unnamed protein product [Bursaphelenchus okinawaensis]|uniref:chitin synthase n=1 Tax=Bursaphelenchus okinawaensis TaxID=465554 RepID=A0A811KZ14_9BILA|nr:unnamed protein product [Bursaphelenchus okinawaensis]CAG9113241.1 unnamed protein product [Bursaphelenchus okinawaensis]